MKTKNIAHASNANQWQMKIDEIHSNVWIDIYANEKSHKFSIYQMLKHP